MRKPLSINLLIACLMMTACSDHVGTIVTDQVGPEAPINEPDQGVFSPSDPGAGGSSPVAGGTTGAGTSGGGNGAGGSSQPDPVGGGTAGGTGGGSTGGATHNPGLEGGNNGGQPVPEPGTLLLVGSGLAGVGASLLRRRRRREDKGHA